MSNFIDIALLGTVICFCTCIHTHLHTLWFCSCGKKMRLVESPTNVIRFSQLTSRIKSSPHTFWFCSCGKKVRLEESPHRCYCLAN